MYTGVIKIKKDSTFHDPYYINRGKTEWGGKVLIDEYYHVTPILGGHSKLKKYTVKFHNGDVVSKIFMCEVSQSKLQELFNNGHIELIQRGDKTILKIYLLWVIQLRHIQDILNSLKNINL